MKNGFTLIELLAVIVILAIIALIATPIILGIINDAREKANERSVELYASAVRNAIASYQLTNPNAPTKFSDLDVEYDGEIECAIEELYADESFYIADCTVNGTEVDYTYGEKQELPSTQVYKPQYYYLGYDFYGKIGTTSMPENPLTLPPVGKSYYIGYDVINGIVSTGYICFVRNETEYCLKGSDEEAFDTNTEVLEDAFKDVENACVFGGVVDGSNCRTDDFYVSVYGDVLAHDFNYPSLSCWIYSDGIFRCEDI